MASTMNHIKYKLNKNKLNGESFTAYFPLMRMHKRYTNTPLLAVIRPITFPRKFENNSSAGYFFESFSLSTKLNFLATGQNVSRHICSPLEFLLPVRGSLRLGAMVAKQITADGMDVDFKRNAVVKRKLVSSLMQAGPGCGSSVWY